MAGTTTNSIKLTTLLMIAVGVVIALSALWAAYQIGDVARPGVEVAPTATNAPYVAPAQPEQLAPLLREISAKLDTPTATPYRQPTVAPTLRLPTFGPDSQYGNAYQVPRQTPTPVVQQTVIPTMQACLRVTPSRYKDTPCLNTPIFEVNWFS